MNEEIKAVVAPVLGVAALIEDAADGVSLSEIYQLVGVLKKIQPAVASIKSGKVVAQYANLDDAGKADLQAWFEKEFDLKNDNVEKVVEQAWQVALSLSDLAKLLKPQVVQAVGAV